MQIISVLFILLGLNNFSFGSENKLSCSQFVSSDKRFFLLGQAYSASDLVVIGSVYNSKKLILKISKKIKGAEITKEIELVSAHCQGTACSGGFSVALKTEMLFFLKRQLGVYDSVTGNGTFKCPVVYEIEGKFVKFGEKKILIDDLEVFLQSKTSRVLL